MALSKIRTEGLSVGGSLATAADLALVAFDSIRADNRSALKMDNAFVDQFEDATGIDTTSTAARNSSEYVTTNGSTTVEYNPFEEETWAGSGNVSADNTLGYSVNGHATAFRSTATGSGYAYTTTTKTADSTKRRRRWAGVFLLC